MGLPARNLGPEDTPPAGAQARFDQTLEVHGLPLLTRQGVTTLQVNAGRLCDLACHHCHVEAGPKRTEVMPEAVAERVLELVASHASIEVLDLTGGAPEMNPNFRRLVREVRRLGRRVLDRCNLTILSRPGQEDTAAFLAEQGVEVVASLPCYTKDNVDRQRGRGVYDLSIHALQRLNALGYGRSGSPLKLDLVFNPQGPSLPAPQEALEADYRRELRSRFGIEFSRLRTLTNMPIRRFASLLRRTGRQEAYMGLLVNHFNPATVPHLMCRTLLSVRWDGRLFDCDFNQMLDLDLGGAPRNVWEVASLEDLAGGRVATGPHCFGCTAGAGSSCGGALQ